MQHTRWWHGAVLATSAVLAALVYFSTPSPLQAGLGFAAIAVFVAGWFLVGWNAYRTQARSVGFMVVLVVVGAAGSLATPTFATFQTIAYPLMWTRSRSTRSALIANIALAAAVGAGYATSAGGTPEDIVRATVIQSISLSFSIAMGLWFGQIADRSEERQRLLDELRATQDKLAAASRDAGVASERERLAREIHDTIAQDLTGLVLLTQRARRDLDDGDQTSLDEQLAMVEENARLALAETRALVAATAPVGLATGGIGDALDRLGARFGRETGLAVTVSATGLPVLERDTEVVLLRCAQEALANVRKHARASAASVTVTHVDGRVTLTVRDDGGGFDPTSATDGFGLSGMRERLALVGGELRVDSAPGETTLTVTLAKDDE